jgi:hypothetical protein
LVPNDPWVVAQVVGILWVVAHRPLWTRLVVVSLDYDDTHYVVVALVYSSGLYTLDEMRMSTLVVDMYDVREKNFIVTSREGRRHVPCAEDLKVQVSPIERHHLDVIAHKLDLYI